MMPVTYIFPGMLENFESLALARDCRSANPRLTLPRLLSKLLSIGFSWVNRNR